MEETEAAKLQQVLDALERYQLLLESDARLPSVVGIIVGEPVRGSWWGHEQGNIIYDVANELSIRPNILTIKFISGKVTFIHQNLWSAIMCIGTAGEPWQVEGLTYVAHWLFEKVKKDGSVETNRLQSGFQVKAIAEAARELEKRLLVYGESFHSKSGSHAKRLETWEYWASRRHFNLQTVELTVDENKMLLEERLKKINAQFKARGKLPWN